jgi:hypothetical protein
VKLLVQQFLEKHSFATLRAAYGVNARPSADGSKWSLNYDQIAAKPGCPVADQCRGLILRPGRIITEDDGGIIGPTTIVARPMDRFFNAGDSVAAPIDWKTARIQEKLDGTMCIVYYDTVKQEWHIGTRAVPEADVPFGSPPGSPLLNNTFAELFLYAMGKTREEIWGHPPAGDLFYTAHGQFFTGLNKEWTYVYELTSPLNRVVVKYDKYRVTMLAARETQTGDYVTDQVRYEEFLCLPSEWRLNTLDEIRAFVDCSDPAKIEGAVVIDANNNRVKVKSKAWILASRSKDMVTLSKRGALRSIIDGSITNVLPLLDSDVVEYIEQLQGGLKEYSRVVDISAATFKKVTTDRKAYALMVQASGLWTAPFYAIYGGKYVSTLDWLQKLCEVDKLTDTMLDTVLNVIS